MDTMWAQHKGPLYAASIELFVAARTDADLRKRLAEVERDVTRTISKGMLDLAPDSAAKREFRDADRFDLVGDARIGAALLRRSREGHRPPLGGDARAADRAALRRGILTSLDLPASQHVTSKTRGA